MKPRPHHARGFATALAAALLLAACTPAGTSEKGTTGARSAGDPLFPKLGNGGYDVGHYRLRLDYDTDSHRLDATAVITATATQPLRNFSLDLSGLTVTRVSVDGARAGSRRTADKLIVEPARTIEKGATFRTTVDYGGLPKAMTDPDGSAEGWVRTDDGAFVVGEPVGSMTWFPGNNHPSDKATYDFEITVPKGRTAVANGELRRERTADGRTTFVWHSGEPIASYLVTATIGKFQVIRSRTNSGLPSYVAVDPREAAGSKKSLSEIGKIIDWETGLFGPYPFSSTGAVVDHKPKGITYALETQTKPIYSSPPDRVTVVHELAHQWFGNSVTPERWQDLWLNEGFATYAEWLWQEQHGGDSAQKNFDKLYARDEKDPLWAFPAGNPPRAKDIFAEPVYDRGAMVLQELRRAVGDATFFAILKGWAAKHRYGNADSAQFIAFCEAKSGKDLRGLFDTWLYAKGKPKRP